MRRLARSQSGQVFTIEFAMSVIGIVAIAFVVAAVANWGLGWLSGSSKAYNATRQQAGQDPAPWVPAPGAGNSLNLIGPAGPESLGGTQSSVSPSKFSEPCDSAGKVAEALEDRAKAEAKLNGMRAVDQRAISDAGKAEYYYAQANALEPIIQGLKDQLAALQTCTDPEPPTEPPVCGCDPVTMLPTPAGCPGPC